MEQFLNLIREQRPEELNEDFIIDKAGQYFRRLGTELEFVIMVIAVSCVKLLSAHNSTQHTSRKHKV
jgi:hypothetical protein